MIESVNSEIDTIPIILKLKDFTILKYESAEKIIKNPDDQLPDLAIISIISFDTLDAAVKIMTTLSNFNIPFLILSDEIDDRLFELECTLNCYGYISTDSSESIITSMIKTALRLHQFKLKFINTENKLRESEYRLLTENTSDVIYRTKIPEAEYEFVSPSSEKVFGFSPDNFYRDSNLLLSIMNPEWKNYFFERWKDIQNNILHDYYEFSIIHPVSKEIRWLYQKNYWIYNSKNQLIALQGNVTDITELKRKEKELTDNRELLFHSRKMDAVGKLAGGMAHDFNNMLGGILGSAQILKKNCTPGSKEEKFIDLIIRTSKRAGDLTSKLLTFSKKEKTEFKIIDIHSLIEDTAVMLTHSLNRNIDIVINTDASNYTIMGDASQVQNIFLNMGINSGRAMKNGGTLIFKTRNINLNQDDCEKIHFNIKQGEYLCIEIRDTGCGIPKENLMKIFEPFYTTREGGEGTGLGLATAYGTIQLHRGAVEVQSKAGEGTVFFIYLPIESITENQPDFGNIC